MGLNASGIVTFVPNTPAKSGDVNNTVSGLNTASAPTFTTCQVGGVNVAVEGAHSLGTPILSYGNGAPSSLAANEIFFQFT